MFPRLGGNTSKTTNNNSNNSNNGSGSGRRRRRRDTAKTVDADELMEMAAASSSTGSLAAYDDEDETDYSHNNSSKHAMKDAIPGGPHSFASTTASSNMESGDSCCVCGFTKMDAALVVVIFCFALTFGGAIWFVSAAYEHPEDGSGFRKVLQKWIGRDDTEASTRGLETDVVNPVFFLMFFGIPTLLAALVNEFFIAKSRREGILSSSSASPGSTFPRGVAPSLLNWSSTMITAIPNTTRGEVLLVVMLIVGNLLAFLASFVPAANQIQTALLITKDSDNDEGESDDLSEFELRSNALMKVTANALGYMALFSLGQLLLFFARPTSDFWMSSVFGLPHQKTKAYARWLGVWIALASLLHMVFYIRPFVVEGVFSQRMLYLFSSTDEDNEDNAVLDKKILFGELVLLCFAVLGCWTLFHRPLKARLMRGQWYDRINRILITLIIIFLHLHYQDTIWWLLPGVVMYTIAFLHRIANRRVPVQVIDFAFLRNGLTRLVLAASHRPLRSFSFDASSQLPSFSQDAGRFVWICLPSVGRSYWHRAFVASSPTMASESITIYVNAPQYSTGATWSQDTYDHAQLCRRQKRLPLVYMDGYYGYTPMDRLPYSSHILLIGQGDLSKVAPVLSILQELVASYSVFQGDIDATMSQFSIRKVCFVWTCEHLSFFKEIEPVLRQIKRIGDRFGEQSVFHVRLFLTKPPSEVDDQAFTDRTPLCQLTKSQFAATRIKKRHPPMPFRRAFHTASIYQVAIWLVVMASLALLMYLIRSISQDDSDSSHWVMFRLLELLMVGIAAGFGYGVAYIERKMLRLMRRLVMGNDYFVEEDDLTSQEMRRLQHSMVAGGFDVIAPYEYESGVGFIGEYGVQLGSPDYEGILLDVLYDSPEDFEECQFSGRRRVKNQRIVDVQIAAPPDVSKDIQALARSVDSIAFNVGIVQ